MNVNPVNAQSFQIAPSQAENNEKIVNNAVITTNSDTFDKQIQEKKPEKFSDKFFNFVATIKKFFVSGTEWTIGAFKGLFEGSIAAAVTILGAKAINAIKNHKADIKKPLKKPLLIALGATSGLAFFVKNLYQTKLKVNGKNHDIDRAYQRTPILR